MLRAQPDTHPLSVTSQRRHQHRQHVLAALDPPEAALGIGTVPDGQACPARCRAVVTILSEARRDEDNGHQTRGNALQQPPPPQETSAIGVAKLASVVVRRWYP